MGVKSEVMRYARTTVTLWVNTPYGNLPLLWEQEWTHNYFFSFFPFFIFSFLKKCVSLRIVNQKRIQIW